MVSSFVHDLLRIVLDIPLVTFLPVPILLFIETVLHRPFRYSAAYAGLMTRLWTQAVLLATHCLVRAFDWLIHKGRP